METIEVFLIKTLVGAFIGSLAGSYSARRKVPSVLKPKIDKWILSILKATLSGLALTIILEVCLSIVFSEAEAELERMQQTVAFAIGIGFGMFFMRKQIKKNV